MKRVFFNLAIVFAAIGMVAFTNHVETKKVSAANSKIVWKGYKVTGEHAGTINLKSGSLDFDHGALVGGSFTIDMSTLAVTDLEGEYATKLAGHLTSDDFFGVANYPEAKFVIKKVVSRGTPGDYKIVGDLTIKATTQEIKFGAKVTEENGKTTAMADITIDRSDFDVRYGSGSFFEKLGDKTIYDEFDLSIQLVTE